MGKIIQMRVAIGSANVDRRPLLY